MKKIILTSALLSTLVLAANTSFAATQEAESDVSVELKAKQNHDVNPGDYYNTLSIVYKPTAYAFKGSISVNEMNLVNDPQTSLGKYIAVNDDRVDTTTGVHLKESSWSLTAKLSELKDTKTNNTLAATLNIKPAGIIKYNIGSNLVKDATTGKLNFVPEAIDDSAAAAAATYTASSTAKLEAAGSEKVILASQKSSLPNDDTLNRGVAADLGDAQLNIAGGKGSTAGNYTGKITYTLNDTYAAVQ